VGPGSQHRHTTRLRPPPPACRVPDIVAPSPPWTEQGCLCRHCRIGCLCHIARRNENMILKMFEFKASLY
jgi:hypothetical protein